MTLEQFIQLIPSVQRQSMEDEIGRLLESGWGELSFKVVNHTVSGYKVSVDVNFDSWSKRAQQSD